MAKLIVDLDVETHAHSETAHIHFIGQMLDQVKQSVGHGLGHGISAGEITTPPVGAQQYPAVVGSWKFIED